MKLIVGLGNPGTKYEKTRHNIGFMAVDFLIKNEQLDSRKIKFIKPQNFMNNSGRSVKEAADYYKIKPEDIIVIHDDIDLPLGEIKIQQNRSSAGHKGVQSIIDSLGTKNFTRIRIGIKPEKLNIEIEKFVTQKFTSKEKGAIQQAIKRTAQLIKTI